MLIRHSYDTRFITLMEKLRSEYGEEMFKLSGIGSEALDINGFSKQYFLGNGNTADKSIDSNANVSDKSVLSWENESAKPLKKLNAIYLIWKSALVKYGIKRANKMVDAEIRGAIRIHDLYKWLTPYCWAGSLDGIVHKGMPFYDKIKIGPTKHFDSYINLSLQYICYISNQIAGAVALPDFFIYADYFVRKDYGEKWHTDEKLVSKINQLFQNWIYSVNFSWRSNQSPFTNISVMDKYWLEALFATHANPDFSKPDFDNVMRLQKMFVNEMVRNLRDNIFTFPVVTACLLYDESTKKCKDEDFLQFVSEVGAETGLFNYYVDSRTSSLSSCCRLRSNIEEANKEYTNSFGAGGVSIGSHRVVTMNLPQIAYQAEDWTDFMKILDYRVNLGQDILDLHRDTMKRLIGTGHLPMYNYGFMFLEKQFSTIGFIGLNEALEIMGFDIMDNKGHEKAKEILDCINTLNLKRSKQDGNIRNIEQIPGESAASNLAKKDKNLFDEAGKYKIYSNQYIPLIKNVDMSDRIVAQGRYDKDCGGGSILHINVQERISTSQVKKLIQYCASKGVIYFAINYNFCQCVTCNKIYVGKLTKSPCHNADVKKYLRIVGFLTNVENWDSARQEEYKSRQFYKDM